MKAMQKAIIASLNAEKKKRDAGETATAEWYKGLEPKLLKIGALVKTSFRRILFSMASAFPYVDDYAAAWAALHSAA